MDAKVLPSAEEKLKRMRERRWEHLVSNYSKIMRVRPISNGGSTSVFIRQAMVTIPSEIMENISKIDLAMVVASGPRIIYHSVEHCDESHYKPGQSLKEKTSRMFKVKVILDPDMVLEKKNKSIIK